MITDDRILFALPPRGIDPARLTLATAPAVEPWLVTDAEVGYHLKLDSDADAAYVTLLLKAARRHFEQMTGLALITQTLRATYDRLPVRNGASLTEFELPRAPLQSVSYIKYLDTSGVEQTFSSSSYSAVNTATRPAVFGRVALKPDYAWPDLGDYRGAFYVNFLAGFGDAATDVPEDIRLALLWLAAWWYESRTPVNVGNIINELPSHLNDLIASHRVAFVV